MLQSIQVNLSIIFYNLRDGHIIVVVCASVGISPKLMFRSTHYSKKHKAQQCSNVDVLTVDVLSGVQLGCTRLQREQLRYNINAQASYS